MQFYSMRRKMFIVGEGCVSVAHPDATSGTDLHGGSS